MYFPWYLNVLMVSTSSYQYYSLVQMALHITYMYIGKFSELENTNLLKTCGSFYYGVINLFSYIELFKYN